MIHCAGVFFIVPHLERHSDVGQTRVWDVSEWLDVCQWQVSHISRPESYVSMLYESDVSYRSKSSYFSLLTYCCPEWWEIFAGSCGWHWAVHTAPAWTERSGWSLPRSRHCHQRCLTQSFLTLTGSLPSPPLWNKIQSDLYIQEKNTDAFLTLKLCHICLCICILLWTTL